MVTKIEAQARNLKALRAFDALSKFTGRTPALREWAEAAGVTYPTLCNIRDNLVIMGLMETEPYKSRSLKITPKGFKALKEEEN